LFDAGRCRCSITTGSSLRVQGQLSLNNVVSVVDGFIPARAARDGIVLLLGTRPQEISVMVCTRTA
jgi:hypothetical protein